MAAVGINILFCRPGGALELDVGATVTPEGDLGTINGQALRVPEGSAWRPGQRLGDHDLIVGLGPSEWDQVYRELMRAAGEVEE